MLLCVIISALCVGCTNCECPELSSCACLSGEDVFAEYSDSVVEVFSGVQSGSGFVIERDGEFYLKNGLEIALAYSFNMDRFIPSKLVSGEPSGEYVRMKNSL